MSGKGGAAQGGQSKDEGAARGAGNDGAKHLGLPSSVSGPCSQHLQEVSKQGSGV